MAGRISSVRALVFASISLGSVVVPTLSFLIGQIAEPYRDLDEYLRHVAMVLPPMLVFGGLVSIVVTFLVAALAALWDRLLHPGGELRASHVRAVVLNLHAMLIPLAAWQVACVLKTLGHPAFGLLEPKPALWTSPVVTSLGSLTGGALFLGLYGLNLLLAQRQLGSGRPSA